MKLLNEVSMIHSEISEPFAALRETHPNIYVIVSPPRCSSTAFSRVLWEQPTVRYYCHEPFEVTYYWDQGLDAVVDKLADPLDLQPIKSSAPNATARDLVIKEMPYQVGSNFPLLAALATRPVVFLIRDPRQNIASRIEKKIVGGDSPEYPFVESGWDLLSTQISYCRKRDIPHVLVDSKDFRNEPQTVFKRVLDAFGLPFSEASLSWRACSEVELDNLEGAHRHLYERVLGSDGIQPADEPVPDLASFTQEGGWRDHVARCLEIYRDLRESSALIDPAPSTG